jgi:hypothetical protein
VFHFTGDGGAAYVKASAARKDSGFGPAMLEFWGLSPFDEAYLVLF